MNNREKIEELLCAFNTRYCFVFSEIGKKSIREQNDTL